MSRIAGFARTAASTYFFGASATADVWAAAFRTPNFIQNLLGEGTLSASFIPIYAEFIEKGEEEKAGHFAGAVLGLLTLAAFTLAGIGILLAPVFVPLFFPKWNPAQHELGIRLIRILLLMTAVLAVSAWALGVLNSHRRFFVSYVAPVAWNLAIIGALAAGAAWVGPAQEDIAVAGAWGGAIGALLQLGVQLPFVVPVLKHFRLSLSRSVVGVKEAIRTFIPVVTARGVVNLSSYLDTFLAGLLATGAQAYLSAALTLFLLPISLFGMSITASELPEMARQREAAALTLKPRIDSALARVSFLLVPSAFAFIVLGDVFIGALFQHGEFGPVDTAVCYAVLAGFSLAMIASGSSRIVSSAFYALRDTKTPARIAYVRVAVSTIAGIALMIPLDRVQIGSGDAVHGFGAAGLALGFSLGGWVEWVMLRKGLSRALGTEATPFRLIGGRILLAGLVAALVGVGAKWILGSRVPFHPGLLLPASGDPSKLVSVALAAGTALAFGVSYLAIAAALGMGGQARRFLRR